MASRSFTVEGKWPFPADMLRYDSCWPIDTESLTTMCDLVEGEDLNLTWHYKLRLATARRDGPTVARWESFGWRVIEGDR